MDDDLAVFRRLARDQWVRLHGTPRVTVLVGEARARRLWSTWAELAGCDAVMLEDDDDLDGVLRGAHARAAADVVRPIAVVTSVAALDRWRPTSDRLQTLVREGVLHVAEPASSRAPLPLADGVVTTNLDARSIAEATLFEALEATPATAGRFELNGRLSVRFGPDAAEVDLLSRADAIAIEIDGYHHFTDPDCYRRDRRKDLLLQTQGLLVIRLLADDVVRDPRDAVNMVCQALACRRGTQR